MRISPFPSAQLDIIYSAQPSCTTMLVKVGSFERAYPILQGGQQLLCIDLPDQGNQPWELKTDGPCEVISMRCREAPGEFAPLIHDPAALKAAASRMNFLPVTVQWFVTWRCNYQCDYCWQETVADAYRKTQRWAEETVDTWVQAIKKLNPEHLYLSGGEPTLHPDIIPLVSRLGLEVNPVYMTSNLGKSFDVDRWIAEVPPEAIDNLTFSFHPTQAPLEEFVAKWERLIQHFGPNKIGLEIVDTPGNHEFVDPIKRLADKHDPRVINVDHFHVQPPILLHPPSEGPFDHTPDFRSGSPMNFLPQTDPGKLPVYCAAGMKRINVDPMGDAYVCMSAIDRSKMFGQHSLGHYKPIGNVLDPGFELQKHPTLCWESFRCSGCDVAHVAGTWTKHPSQEVLPLPE